MKTETQVTFAAVDKLQPNPFQPRGKVFEDEEFNELVASVAVHGVLEPLVVVETPAGTHIIAGERRWRAAKKNNLATVPVHIIKTSPRGMLEMAVIENVQRVDLNPMERAQALKRLITEFGYTPEEVGQRIGKSRTYVNAQLQLLQLPDPIRDALIDGVITEGHARAMLGAGNEKDILTCFKQTVAEAANVRRTEAIARFLRLKHQTQTNETKHRQHLAIVDVDAYRDQWQNAWSKKLTSKTKIQVSDSSKNTRITITLNGDAASRKKDLEKIAKIAGL